MDALGLLYCITHSHYSLCFYTSFYTSLYQSLSVKCDFTIYLNNPNNSFNSFHI